jgi:TetR/AcrR family transcriptional repressor of nem operon
MFDAEVRRMNVDYVLKLRRRFEQWIGEIVEGRQPREPVDPAVLADHLTAIVEGSIILSKAVRDEGLMGRQTRLFRQYVKLLFGA